MGTPKNGKNKKLKNGKNKKLKNVPITIFSTLAAPERLVLCGGERSLAAGDTFPVVRDGVLVVVDRLHVHAAQRDHRARAPNIHCAVCTGARRTERICGEFVFSAQCAGIA